MVPSEHFSAVGEFPVKDISIPVISFPSRGQLRLSGPLSVRPEVRDGRRGQTWRLRGSMLGPPVERVVSALRPSPTRVAPAVSLGKSGGARGPLC